MVGFQLGAVVTSWSALAADVIVESTLDASDRLVLFGRTVAVTSSTIEVFVCVALGMSIAVLATAAVSGAVRRRRESQLRAEVDQRWEQLSMHHAGMEARNELLDWRVQDLQDQIHTLLARRDALLADATRDLGDAKDTVRATRSRDALRRLQDGVIALPDLEDDPSGADADPPPARRPSVPGDNVRRFPA